MGSTQIWPASRNNYWNKKNHNLQPTNIWDRSKGVCFRIFFWQKANFNTARTRQGWENGYPSRKNQSIQEAQFSESTVDTESATALVQPSVFKNRQTKQIATKMSDVLQQKSMQVPRNVFSLHQESTQKRSVPNQETWGLSPAPTREQSCSTRKRQYRQKTDLLQVQIYQTLCEV